MDVKGSPMLQPDVVSCGNTAAVIRVARSICMVPGQSAGGFHAAGSGAALHVCCEKGFCFSC